MEFTPEISAFQGTIISADNLHSFSKLTTKGGNEKQIQEIITILQAFLREKYINANGVVNKYTNEMRKFAFYIVLNTDLSILNELVNMEGIDCVVWTVPTISKHLMAEIMWSTYMDQFVYEIIVFCYPELALEVASAMINNLKYSSPTESVNKLKVTSEACYRAICRLHFYNMDNDKLDSNLTALFNNFQKCLTYFETPPNEYKLNNLKKDEKYKYKGHCLEAMLQVVMQCVQHYTTKQEFNTQDFVNIYHSTLKEDFISSNESDYNICDSPNKNILECLNKCNEVLLDTCQKLVMDVNVRIFCAWSEYEEDNKSLQQIIGEIAYKLRCKLTSVASLMEHPVVGMLEQISQKPIEYKEAINDMDVAKIAEIMDKNDTEKALWIGALIHREHLCTDNALLDLLSSNLDILNHEQCYELHKILRNYISSQNNEILNDNQQQVILLANEVFQKCTKDIQINIIAEHIGPNIFNNVLETPNLASTTTEIFNKLIASPESDLSQVYPVFIQNPEHVLRKVFTLATESAQQCEIMIKVMLLLKSYNNHYYSRDTEPSIIKLARTVCEENLDTDIKERNYVKFLVQLKKEDVIPGPKLLLLILMPLLHNALVNKSSELIRVMVTLLHHGFSLEELMVYRAPILVMLARLLDMLRWSLNTFHGSYPHTLKVALDVQQSLMNTYDGNITDTEKNWLLSRLRHGKTLNMFYYRKLWDPPGRNFVEVVIGKELHREMNIRELTLWLTKILTSATEQEYVLVWRSLLVVFSERRALDCVQAALGVLGAATRGSTGPTNRGSAGPTSSNAAVTSTVAAPATAAAACLLHCYRCYAHLALQNYLQTPLRSEQVEVVCKHIASFVNSAEGDAGGVGGAGAVCAVFAPLLSQLAARRDEHDATRAAGLLRATVRDADRAHMLADMLAPANLR